MRRGQCADPHHGRDGGNAGLFHKRPQLLLGMRRENTPARTQNRALRILNGLDRLAQLQSMSLAARLVADDIGRFAVIEIRDGFLLHIDRHVDQYRPRPAGPGNIKGFLENPRDIRGVFDDVAVLGKRFRRAGDVRLLEDVAAEQVAAHLAGDHHQRDGIHVCGGDAGDQVGGARAGGGNAYTDLAGNTGIPAGRMRSVLLGTYEHMMDPAADEAVVKRAYRSAGVTKRGGHAFELQAFYHSGCAGHHGLSYPLFWSSCTSL